MYTIGNAYHISDFIAQIPKNVDSAPNRTCSLLPILQRSEINKSMKIAININFLFTCLCQRRSNEICTKQLHKKIQSFT